MIQPFELIVASKNFFYYISNNKKVNIILWKGRIFLYNSLNF